MDIPDGLTNWKHRWRPSLITLSLMCGTSAGIPVITSRSKIKNKNKNKIKKLSKSQQEFNS